MLQRGRIAQIDPEAGELGWVEVLPPAERPANLFRDLGPRRDPVELDAVAGAEDRELAQPRQRC